MSGAFSSDLRGRVLDAAEAGSSVRQAAARFGVGVSTAIRWVRRWRESGERTARKQGHPIRSKLDAHARVRRSAMRRIPFSNWPLWAAIILS
jgi:transposase